MELPKTWRCVGVPMDGRLFHDCCAKHLKSVRYGAPQTYEFSFSALAKMQRRYLNGLHPQPSPCLRWVFPVVNPAYTSLEYRTYMGQEFNMAHRYAPESEDPTSMADGSEFNGDWSPDLDPDDLRELRAAQLDPTKIVTELPKEAVRMGYYSTICLIFNRMIGML